MKITKDGDHYLVAADNFINLQESKDYFFIPEKEYEAFRARAIQADREALKEKIEKKRKEIEIYTFDDKDLNGAQRLYHAYKSGVCDGKLVMTDDILTLLEETKS